MKRDWSVLILVLGLVLILAWGVFFYSRIKAGIERQLAQRTAQAQIVEGR